LSEAHRQDALATGLLQVVLLACAVALLVAGLRQWRLLAAGGANAAGSRATEGPPALRVVVIVVGAALIVAGAAPLIARVVVWSDGSLMGFGPVPQFSTSEAKVPTATTPTPVASPSASARGPVVTGVVPGPGQASSQGYHPWTGDMVQVNYLPKGTKVIPSKCRLLVNGAPVTVSAVPLFLSRSTQTLNWSLRKPLRAGKYEFTAILVTAAGDEYRWRWTYSY
jgi:hypothetical protein